MKKIILALPLGFMILNTAGFAADMVNSVCPVMPDHKAKAARSVEYKGKTYGFCCKSCIKKFNQNPEKYIAGLAAEKDCAAGGCADGKK